MVRAGIALLVVASVLLAGGATAAERPRWAWPVESRRIVRGFEAPATPYAAGHRGVDLAASPGAVVHAPDDGRVAFAARVVDRPVLSMDHDGVRSTLEPVDASVRVGDVVHRGEPVGVLARGGSHAPGVLHVGARVRTGGGWAYVSPLLYLGGARRAVLLPLEALPEP